MDTNEALSVICFLVESIEKLYNSVSDEWVLYSKEKNVYCFNQKAKKVIEFKTNNKMSESFREYISFLKNNEKIASFKDIVEKDFSVVSRIKHINSVVEKIDEYQNYREQKGEVSVNKCLNDLFGIRIVVNCTDLDTKTIENFLSGKFSDTVSVNEKNHRDKSSELTYKATHVYFKRHGGNCLYRWELQIWKSCDEENNLKSHEKHRYKYTKWVKAKI